MAGFRCEVCDYTYDEATGAPREGFPAGTPWAAVPDDWTCPDCGVREKLDFVPVGSLAVDSLPADSLPADSPAVDSLPVDSLPVDDVGTADG